MKNLFYENLCSYEEFANMTQGEREEYVNKLFNGAPKKILGYIMHIRPNVMRIKATHFLTADNKAIKFQLCNDESLSTIGSTGRRDKLKGTIEDFCKENNFSKGTKIICIIRVEESQDVSGKRHFLTFDLKTLDSNIKPIEETYKKYNLIYQPHQLYKICNDSEETLEILVQNDVSEKIQEILDGGKEKIDNQEIKLQELQNTYGQERENLQKEIAVLKNELNFLRAFDISIDYKEETAEKNYSEENLADFENFDEMISYWKNYLQNSYGLTYTQEILKSLYFGLQTNQLILLTGNPGTGKTSLTKYLSNSFDFEETAIISVQSDWTDKNDLLGYYNPLEKNYIATPFLDALIKFCRQAESQPNKLFIICLDEMNLAHVEHYFAEFLSILQNNREVILYSDSMRQDIIRELKFSGFDIETDLNKIFADMTLTEKKYYFELRRMANMLVKYPARFKIPTNIKFFGTLNQDETTLDISSKVLDRAYVIRLEMFKDDTAESDEKIKLPLRYKLLKDYSATHEEIFDKDKFEKDIGDIVHISRRVTKQILRHNDFDSWVKVLGANCIEDFIIASCLFPKVRFDEDDYRAKKDNLYRLCKGHKLSWEILEQIDDKTEMDFWRR